jgi:N-acetylglutamate synthase
MTIADYDQTLALWQTSPGIGLNERDERSAIADYFARHPGLSQVAKLGEMLIGAVLCGHDGRRGCLHHLAVATEHRHRKIGRELVARCLAALAEVDIDTCHCFVYRDNADGQNFWRAIGWQARHELMIMTHRGRAERH